ncbi:MAG TPA: MFS transporter [Aggregatilineales bacterium]|nr:MFS transporter [Aggregatilineales bacterium]
MDSQNTAQGPNKNALVFILLTGFLSSVGFGIIEPVGPFLVSHYVSDPNSVGSVLGWLVTSYAICQFVAAPALGAFSDKYGRRPILLLCMVGSAVGYLLMGIGGALWVLFLGRIIDGITGGNMSVAFAYVADSTPPGQRGRYFGLMGAVFGIGFIVGPALGGLIARLGVAAPFYVTAALTTANILYGLFFMPESLTQEKRSEVKLSHLNPLSALADVMAVRELRWLLIATFLYTLPFAALQVTIGLFARDSLNWDVAAIGIIFATVGVTDIFVQGLLLQVLLKRFNESQVAIGGFVSVIVGYLLIGAVAFLHSSLSLFAGTVVFAMGDGLVGPSLGGLLSRAAGSRSQGKVQGGSQSVQSLARIAGPFVGGLMYDSLGHASPFLAGAGIVLLAIVVVGTALPAIKGLAPLADGSEPAAV